MKELSIEEKAKAYDEALNTTKNLISAGLVYEDAAIQIFPELAESEDEKIRKSLLEYLHTLPNHYGHSGVCAPEWIAWLEKQDKKDSSIQQAYEYGYTEGKRIERKHWLEKQNSNANKEYWRGYREGKQEILDKYTELEKQGEQKPIDKAEPKFHEGDWVAQGCNILKIRCVGDTHYCFETVGGYVDDMLVSEIDSLYHLWTIQDAKKGDVLYHKAENGIEYIVMNKGLNEFNNIDSYFRYSSINGFDIDIPSVLSAKRDSITPATKEQRDLLFQKMHEAGYEWDAEKKELKKIYVIDEGKAEMDYCFTKMMNGEKVSPQSSTPMSYGKELEERMYEACKRFNAPNTDPNKYSEADLFYAGVKASCDLNTPNWSEEDLKMLDSAISFVSLSTFTTIGKGKNNTLAWLKSLKPQNHWKPSDEQIGVIEAVINNRSFQRRHLDSLYEQLKKLKGE